MELMDFEYFAVYQRVDKEDTEDGVIETLRSQTKSGTISDDSSGQKALQGLLTKSWDIGNLIELHFTRVK